MEIDFGKFKGHKIDDLIKNEPSYCTWLLRQKNILDKPYYDILAKTFTNPDEYYMTWGKYKGLSLTQIREQDPKYLSWLAENQYVKDKCSKLVECLKKYQL
jgi:uncharacterized protein (DUF3820 family)